MHISVNVVIQGVISVEVFLILWLHSLSFLPFYFHSPSMLSLDHSPFMPNMGISYVGDSLYILW